MTKLINRMEHVDIVRSFHLLFAERNESCLGYHNLIIGSSISLKNETSRKCFFVESVGSKREVRDILQ